MKLRGEKTGSSSKKTLVAVIAVFAVLGVCLVGLIVAEDNDSSSSIKFTADSIVYEVVSEHDGEVTVKGCEGYVSTLTIPSTVSFEERVYNVTSISDEAFRYNEDITKVVINEGITKIGSRAFQQNDFLTEIQLPESLKIIGEWAFESSGLVQLVLPNGLETIGGVAFLDCEELREITIPISIDAAVPLKHDVIQHDLNGPYQVTVVDYVFGHCDDLKKVTLTPGNGTWHDYGEHLKHSPWIENKSSVSELVVSDGVTSIPKSCFEGMKNVKQISLPSSVTSFGEYAFKNCESLMSIDMPSGVTRLEKKVFEGCSKLNSIDLSNVTSIGEKAFNGCKNIKTIVFGDGLAELGKDAFKGFKFYDGGKKISTNVENLKGCTFTGKTSKMVKQL